MPVETPQTPSDLVLVGTGQAAISMKNIAGELMSLNPSALLSLYEIDVSSLGFQAGIISSTEVELGINTVFRFHSNINLTVSSIFWNNNEYVAAPIETVGFETNLKGSPAVPTLSMTVSDEGIPQLTILKQRIRELGDIVGAQVTRIRTFAKFIDITNFYNQIPPQGFNPDPSQELPRDIYYIERLANENKTSIQYELSPLFLVDGITLPGRIISEDSCPWNYRGEGCLYEYSNRKTYVHGNGTLPTIAPPVATNLDELISNVVTGVSFVDKGQYNVGQSYNAGETVFIQNRGINYYFVSQVNNNNSAPPNTSGWVQDACSKRILGCKYRFLPIGSGILPFGGFPSVNRFQ
jgi:lambda family phage minor tail protein L